MKRRIIPDDPQVERFTREYSRPGRPVAVHGVVAAATRSRLVLVGDYRPSAYPKRWIRALLRLTPRRVPLFLDVFYRKDDRLVSLWLQGRLSRAELLRECRFDLELGVSFSPYEELLREQTRAGRPVYFLESPVRSDRGTRRRRFLLAAHRIAGVAHCGRAIVLAGQAYLERSFLPAMLRRTMGLKATDVVTVVFPPEQGSGVRDLGHGRFALPMQRPSRSRALRRTEADASTDLAATIYAMADALCTSLGMDPFRLRVSSSSGRSFMRDCYPHVLDRSRPTTTRRLLRASGLDKTATRDCLSRLRRRGSLYVARANAILIGKYRVVDGAEEVAHFIHHALRGEILTMRPSSFYDLVWDEAMGYLGSKILYPDRTTPTLGQLARSRGTGLLEEVRRFVLAHAAMERDVKRLSAVPELVMKGLARGGEFADVAQHALGYTLGERLFAAFREGRLGADRLRRLLRSPTLGPRGALRRYLALGRELGSLHGRSARVRRLRQDVP